MRRFEAEAIILQGIDYGESDRIVTFFTREFGKIRGIAKGAKRSRRRFPNGLDLAYHLYITFVEKEGFELGRVEDSKMIHSFDRISQHPDRFMTACYLLELTSLSIPDREPHPELFDLLKSSFQELERGDWVPEARDFFELKTLFYCGYRPNFEWCGVCQSSLLPTGDRYYSRDKGLVLCEGCSIDLPWVTRLSPETTHVMQRGLETTLDGLKELLFNEKIKEESRRFLGHALSLRLTRPIRSQPLLDAFRR
ncbi:MAG: DNA repair protein RecO [Deltaproteobacteria bacterium]|nr:DNA repair protein RecO [Deltaproteobacteria bacterium]